MEASDHPVQADHNDLAGYGAAAAELVEQSRRIAGLTTAIEEVRRGATEKERGAELGYRFDAYPKWLEASGWKDQSRRHRSAWPALRRLLELERWPGAATRITYPQLADHLCVSEDTAKRRLRDLAGDLGAIELRPGTGRSPSVVVVKHPIHTPLKYDEVPWEAGGLAGAPARYLENLRGAKRHYAELYGAELPAEPAAPGEEPTEPDPPKESGPASGEEPPPTAKAAPAPAPPGRAGCAPLETRESCFVQTSSLSDAREGEERPTEQGREGRGKQEGASKEIEREIKAESPSKVGNEGRFAALALAEAAGRYDELARARLAQAAQYLISRGEVPVLQAVTARIRARRSGGTEIRDPLAYVAHVIQDVRLADKLTPEERELAASVALARGPSSEEQALARDAEAKGRQEDYAWFFGEEPADPQAARAAEEEKRHRREAQARERRRGYEWFFDREPERPSPERSAEDDAPEPEPWEVSSFAGVVPPELWWRMATSAVAGAIRWRMQDLATSGDAEEYRRAREELYVAPWVGEPFKERVIARCDELIRREEPGARMPREDGHS